MDIINIIVGAFWLVFLAAGVALIILLPIMFIKDWWTRRKLMSDPKLATNTYELVSVGVSGSMRIYGYLTLGPDSVKFYKKLAFRPIELRYDEITEVTSDKNSFLRIRGADKEMNAGGAVLRPLDTQGSKNYSKVPIKTDYLATNVTTVAAVKERLASSGADIPSTIEQTAAQPSKIETWLIKKNSGKRLGVISSIYTVIIVLTLGILLILLLGNSDGSQTNTEYQSNVNRKEAALVLNDTKVSFTLPENVGIVDCSTNNSGASEVCIQFADYYKETNSADPEYSRRYSELTLAINPYDSIYEHPDTRVAMPARQDIDNLHQYLEAIDSHGKSVFDEAKPVIEPYNHLSNTRIDTHDAISIQSANGALHGLLIRSHAYTNIPDYVTPSLDLWQVKAVIKSGAEKFVLWGFLDMVPDPEFSDFIDELNEKYELEDITDPFYEGYTQSDAYFAEIENYQSQQGYTDAQLALTLDILQSLTIQ